VHTCQLFCQGLARKGNCIPVVASFPSDLLTPVSAYLKLCLDEQYAFLLGMLMHPTHTHTGRRCDGWFQGGISLAAPDSESSTGGSKVGRYSFIGRSPGDIITTSSPTEDPLIGLERRLRGIRYVPHSDLPYFTGGAVGYARAF
jgi:anthranilate synthase component 1